VIDSPQTVHRCTSLATAARLWQQLSETAAVAVVTAVAAAEDAATA